MVVLSTLGFEELDQLLVIVHAPGPPAHQEWDTMMRASIEAMNRIKCCLVVAGDSRLNAQQRRSLADVVQGRNFKVAVMVASAVARGMVTALGWFAGGYRAFDMHEIDKALQYLQLTPATQADARRVVLEIQQRLGIGAPAGTSVTGR